MINLPRLLHLACDCRPSRKPEGLDAQFPHTHEPQCAYRIGREAADEIARLAEVERIYEQIADINPMLMKTVWRLQEALKHVLEDDGLVPRATSDCRKVVREALEGDPA